MPFTRDILVDTAKRAWVRFNYSGGAAASYGITGAIFPNELVEFYRSSAASSFF
jgi:hypothetical protein